MEITNETFKNLMELKKKFKENNILLPPRSKYSQFEILSLDERNSFIIDLDRRGKIEMKSKLQERYMGNIALIRLEIDGPPHTNPDGTIISRDHIHIYQEGYDLSWAYELKEFNLELFKDLKNFNKVFTDFCFYCNIEVPGFQMVI